jgi:hypothetical protein
LLYHFNGEDPFNGKCPGFDLTGTRRSLSSISKSGLLDNYGCFPLKTAMSSLVRKILHLFNHYLGGEFDRYGIYDILLSRVQRIQYRSHSSVMCVTDTVCMTLFWHVQHLDPACCVSDVSFRINDLLWKACVFGGV